jgi:hypothetical protein
VPPSNSCPRERMPLPRRNVSDLPGIASVHALRWGGMRNASRIAGATAAACFLFLFIATPAQAETTAPSSGEQQVEISETPADSSEASTKVAPLPPPAIAVRPKRSRVENLHHEVRVDAGLFSAVGFGGLSYGYSPAEVFIAELGVGWGVTGIQLSAMPKLALGSANDRFVGGVGLSYSTGVASPVHDFDSGFRTFWLNVDLGFEHRFENGISFTTALGVTHGLSNTPVGFGVDAKTSPLNTLWLPQFRIGVGYWF